MTEHRKINSFLPHSTRGRKIRLSAWTRSLAFWVQWVAAEVRRLCRGCAAMTRPVVAGTR